jgi:hypothetical protein
VKSPRPITNTRRHESRHRAGQAIARFQAKIGRERKPSPPLAVNGKCPLAAQPAGS